MAEVYPSDATLSALTSDSHSGVEYIATGQAPYYLQYRKELYRHLLASARANDLRVYDEGTLDIGVRAGKFWDGNTLRSFAASAGNTLADDKAAIYVYVDSGGSLVTDEYTAYPDPSIPHIRLATVVTSGGDISSITDDRGQQMWFNPGLAAKAVAANIVCNDNAVVCNNNEVVIRHLCFGDGTT